MRAGILNEPITVITSQIETNDYGEETVEWVEKYKTRAHLVHDGGTRTEVNDEIFYTIMKTFQVRYYVPITEFDRIIWNDQTWRVLNIDPEREYNRLTIRTELVND